MLPTRGYRYCEALASASAFGWYIYPPLNFTLVWDGIEVAWTYEGAGDWYPLRGAQFPGFRQLFEELAPDPVKPLAPPSLVVAREPGIVQIWSGIIAKTAPGWSLLVRGPANMVKSKGYLTLEGLVETDRWMGPLFTNVQMLNTDQLIYFNADEPYIQVQPIHRDHYSDKLLNSYEVKHGLGSLTEAEWEGYHKTIVVPNTPPFRPLGGYAVEVRKRRAQEEKT